MRFVLSCDESYAMPLATALRSLVESNRAHWPLHVHVLTDGFAAALRAKVEASLPAGAAVLYWQIVDLTRFERFTTLGYISKATFARFQIPAALPPEADRVIYLDADLLVLDDLRALWETDLGSASTGAVLDALDPQLKMGSARWPGVPRVSDYFNAGVLLIDVGQWRAQGIAQQALAYLGAHPATPFSDQDALNVVLDERWKRLDARWNFQDHYQTRVEELGPDKRPAIVHFVTSLKPWKATSMSPNCGLYDSFRKRTRFARTPLERLVDPVQAGWYRAKRSLRRYRLLERIWRKVHPARISGGANR
jgi:lipopolysaccharide biosynthesis glycosyltransferase